MIGRELDVLTLDDGSALSSNFIHVAVSEMTPVNKWMKVVITGLTEDGLQASRMTTAQETSWSCVSET